MSRYLVELGLTGQDDYVICYNGALVQQVADQRIIRSQLLTGSDASAIAALADELGVNVHGFGEPGLISPRVSPYTEHESRLIDMPIKLLDFATLPADEQILKVMMIDPEPLLSPPSPSCRYRALPALYRGAQRPYFLEFMNKQSNKGTGVAALAEHLGLDASQVIAVGMRATITT